MQGLCQLKKVINQSVKVVVYGVGGKKCRPKEIK
jgi:hypothetical protein